MYLYVINYAKAGNMWGGRICSALIEQAQPDLAILAINAFRTDRTPKLQTAPSHEKPRKAVCSLGLQGCHTEAESFGGHCRNRVATLKLRVSEATAGTVSV